MQGDKSIISSVSQIKIQPEMDLPKIRDGIYIYIYLKELIQDFVPSSLDSETCLYLENHFGWDKTLGWNEMILNVIR